MGWFISPAAPDRWLSGCWVIIIKMKHPVGKPETSMLLLKFYSTLQTPDLSLFFLFPQVLDGDSAMGWKYGQVEEKKTEGIKLTHFTHTQHAFGSPLSYHLCFFVSSCEGRSEFESYFACPRKPSAGKRSTNKQLVCSY